jgi:hypothetical protein
VNWCQIRYFDVRIVKRDGRKKRWIRRERRGRGQMKKKSVGRKKLGGGGRGESRHRGGAALSLAPSEMSAAYDRSLQR